MLDSCTASIQNQDDLNKELVHHRFRCGFKTYNTHAIIQREMAQQLVLLAKRYLANSYTKMLEIGCGTGLLTREIIETFACRQYFANDLVAEIESNIEVIVNPSGTQHLQFYLGDAEIINLPQHQNVIWSGAVMQWIVDLPNFFIKLSNALQSDGYLIFSSFLENNYHEIKTLTGKGIQYKSLNYILEAAGCCFEVLDVKQWQQKLCFSSPRQVLQHMRFTGVNGVSPTPWTRSHLKQFENNYEQFKTDNGYPLTYHPVLMVLRKK